MTATAEVRPKLLVEALENAAHYSHERTPINPTIEISLLPSGGLRCTGFTRFSAAIDVRPLHKSEGVGTVPVTLVADYEEARELATAVKKSSTYAQKDSMASLRLSESELAVTQGEEILGRLRRSQEAGDFEGDEEHEGLYERLHRLYAGAERDSTAERSGITLLHEVLGKLNKVKCSRPDHNDTLKPLQVDSHMRVIPINQSITSIHLGSVTVLQCIVGLVEVDE